MAKSRNRAEDRRVRLGMAALKATMTSLPGVDGVALKNILDAEANRPMRAPQKQHDLQHGGIFGDGHRQKELF